MIYSDIAITAFAIAVMADLFLFKTSMLTRPAFWTSYAIAQGHWFFDREQILGIYGPLDIPLEEYIFFMVIPMAAIFTIEGVTTVKPHWRKDEFGE